MVKIQKNEEVPKDSEKLRKIRGKIWNRKDSERSRKIRKGIETFRVLLIELNIFTAPSTSVVLRDKYLSFVSL